MASARQSAGCSTSHTIPRMPSAPSAARRELRFLLRDRPCILLVRRLFAIPTLVLRRFARGWGGIMKSPAARQACEPTARPMPTNIAGSDNFNICDIAIASLQRLLPKSERVQTLRYKVDSAAAAVPVEAVAPGKSARSSPLGKFTGRSGYAGCHSTPLTLLLPDVAEFARIRPTLSEFLRIQLRGKHG